MEPLPEKRYNAHAKVRCQKYGNSNDSLMMLENISKTGARLNLVSPMTDFTKGDILRLEIDLDSIQRVRVVNAEVIWSNAGAVGVSFVQPDKVYSKLLQR